MTVDDGSFRYLAPSLLTPNDRQPRRAFAENELHSLAESVRSLGVLQPILAKELAVGSYQIVAGERRWRAAIRAGLAEVPVLIRTVTDGQSLEQALVENLHRVDLNPLEEAAAYQQLMDEFDLTQDEVAVRVGKSRPAVANMVRLLQLPSPVQKMMSTGELGAGQARALLAITDQQELCQLARRVVRDELTVRQVEALIRSRGRSRVVRSGPERPVGVLEVENWLADHLSTRVEVSVGKGRGKVVVEFADLDDLERILQQIRTGGLSADGQ